MEGNGRIGVHVQRQLGVGGRGRSALTGADKDPSESPGTRQHAFVAFGDANATSGCQSRARGL